MSEIYKKLAEDFPKEAMTADNSRGFKLTSIKAQYVRERLNEVLGVDGWETETFVVAQNDKGLAVQMKLTARINDKLVSKVAFGGAPNKKNIGDTFKSAETDALCKVASNFGVGNNVFKGLVDPDTLEVKGTSNASSSKKTTTKSNASKPSFRKPKKPAPVSSDGYEDAF